MSHQITPEASLRTLARFLCSFGSPLEPPGRSSFFMPLSMRRLCARFFQPGRTTRRQYAARDWGSIGEKPYTAKGDSLRDRPQQRRSCLSKRPARGASAPREFRTVGFTKPMWVFTAEGRRASTAACRNRVRNLELPLVLTRLELVSPEDGEVIAYELVLPYRSGVRIGPFGGIDQLLPFPPYDAIYREAAVSGSPFYRLLCAFRIYDGTTDIRRWLREQCQQHIKWTNS